jgi:hypothetical protein
MAAAARPGFMMTVPHYLNENKSDMRGIKSGWYTIEPDGEECVTKIAQLPLIASKLPPGPN